jgi:hypothetical protein
VDADERRRFAGDVAHAQNDRLFETATVFALKTEYPEQPEAGGEVRLGYLT